jgi:hypothetical protein
MLVKDIFHALDFNRARRTSLAKNPARRIPVSEKRRRLLQYSTIARVAADSTAAG